MRKIHIKCKQCGSEKYTIFSRLNYDEIQCSDCGFSVDGMVLHNMGLAISRNNLILEYQGTEIGECRGRI